MNRFSFLVFVGSIVLGCPASGCVGTETGNPEIVGSKVSLVIASSDVARISTSSDLQPSDLLVSDASLSISAVRFTSCQGEEVVFELLELSDGSGDELLLPEGEYCSLVVDLSTSDMTSSPFELQGIRSQDQAAFVVDVSGEGRITLTRPPNSSVIDGSPIDTGPNVGYFLVLDLARVLPSEVVQTTTVGTTGAVQVDSQSSVETAAQVASNLAHSFLFVADANESGSLDAEELMNPLLASP